MSLRDDTSRELGVSRHGQIKLIHEHGPPSDWTDPSDIAEVYLGELRPSDRSLWMGDIAMPANPLKHLKHLEHRWEFWIGDLDGPLLGNNIGWGWAGRWIYNFMDTSQSSPHLLVYVCPNNIVGYSSTDRDMNTLRMSKIYYDHGFRRLIGFIRSARVKWVITIGC